MLPLPPPLDGNCDVRVICGTLKSPRSLSRPRPVACGSAVARQPLLTFLTIGSTRSFRVAFLPTPEIDRFPSFLAPVMDRGLFRRGNNLRFFPSRGASPASPCDDPGRFAYHVPTAVHVLLRFVPKFFSSSSSSPRTPLFSNPQFAANFLSIPASEHVECTRRRSLDLSFDNLCICAIIVNLSLLLLTKFKDRLDDGHLCLSTILSRCAGNWFADHKRVTEPYTMIRRFLFLFEAVATISLDRNH